MTHSHGMDSHSHQNSQFVDAAVHNIERGFGARIDYTSIYADSPMLQQANMINGRLGPQFLGLPVNEVGRRFGHNALLPPLQIAFDVQNNAQLMARPGQFPSSGLYAGQGHHRYGHLHAAGHGHSFHHRRFIPPPLDICDGGGMSSVDAGALNVNADACGTVGGDAGNGVYYGANRNTGSASPYSFASYRAGTTPDASLPDVNITDGGAVGGAPDQRAIPIPVTADQGQPPVEPVVQPAVQGLQPSDQGLPGIPPWGQGAQPGDQGRGQPGDQGVKPTDNPTTVPVARVPDSQLTMSGAPTITPEKINEVLASYHSPAAGMGQYIYDEGVKHGINPAMALAFYVVESACGTKGLAVQNKSWGNVRGNGPHGYRPYDSIKDSLDQWYGLINNLYINKFHADKLGKVVSHYSPNSDGNNEASYVRTVGQLVRKWQA